MAGIRSADQRTSVFFGLDSSPKAAKEEDLRSLFKPGTFKLVRLSPDRRQECIPCLRQLNVPGIASRNRPHVNSPAGESIAEASPFDASFSVMRRIVHVSRISDLLQQLLP